MPPTNSSTEKKESNRHPRRRATAPGEQAAEPTQTHVGASAVTPTGLIQRIQDKTQTLSSTDVSYLQRTVGNRAVADILGRKPKPQSTPSGGAPISRSTIATSQPLIQRVLDENGKRSVYDIVRQGRNEVYNTFATRKKTDPAANALLRLSDATAELAEAARDHPDATSTTVGKINTMFKNLSQLASLGQGGGYVDPKKYDKQMGSMWDTLDTAGGLHNTFQFKGKNTEGVKLEGFKRAMSYIGGGLMNIFAPLYAGTMQGVMGKSAYHAKQAVKAYDTLTSDDNDAYHTPLREFRESAQALATLDGSLQPEKSSSKPKKHDSMFDDYLKLNSNDQDTKQVIDINDSEESPDLGENDDFMKGKKPVKNTTVKNNFETEDILQNSPLPSTQRSTQRSPSIQRQTVPHIQRFSFGRKDKKAMHVAYGRVMNRLEQFLMKRNAQAISFGSRQDENIKRARITSKVAKGQLGVYKGIFGLNKKKDK